MFKKIGLVILGAVLGLLVTEFVLRFALIDKLFYRVNVEGVFGTYMLSDNPKLIYLPKSNTGENNKYGYRGKEVPLKQDNSKKRIAFIGDSVVHGLGVTQKERFSDILGERLDAQDEIINFGISGYNISQEAEYLERKVLRFKPKNVIIFTTCNDLEVCSYEQGLLDGNLKKTAEANFYWSYFNPNRYLNEFVWSSGIYKMFLYVKTVRLKKTGTSDTLEYSRIDSKMLDDIIKRLIAVSRQSGFELHFVINPYNSKYTCYSDSIRLIKKALDEHGIPFVDLDQEFDRRFTKTKKKSLFLNQLDQWHLSTAGHKAAADILYEKKDQLGL